MKPFATLFVGIGVGCMLSSIASSFLWAHQAMPPRSVALNARTDGLDLADGKLARLQSKLDEAYDELRRVKKHRDGRIEQSIPTTLVMSGHQTQPTTVETGHTARTPVWVWLEYRNGQMPGFIELNLRALKHNAPDADFDIRFVNKSNIKSWVPDMPEEFDRLPYAAAASDLIRTALIHHHGGVYLDTDFLVARPLHTFTDFLQDFDFVAYESVGQRCSEGRFSSNFIAGRKHNALYAESWKRIKSSLARKCMYDNSDKRQGVCCFDRDSNPIQCHIPWAGIGERTSHPVLLELLESQNTSFRIHCLSRDTEGFVPLLHNPSGIADDLKLDSARVFWRKLDGTPCQRVGDDLTCSRDGGTSKCVGFFNRTAYHLFNSIALSTEYAAEIRASSPSVLLDGDWAISDLYRIAFSGYAPPFVEELAHFSQFPDNKVPGVPIRPHVTLSDSKKSTAVYCNNVLANWSGVPMNPEDDFQCSRLNFTFVHIPKTAGTAIEKVGKSIGVVWGHDYDEKRWNIIKELEKEDKSKAASFPAVKSNHPDINVCDKGCACKNGCCWWHIPPKYLTDFRPYYMPPVRFCIVRNPISRVLSQYSWLGSSTCPETVEDLRARDAYIIKKLQLFRNQSKANLDDCHYIPQIEYIAAGITETYFRDFWSRPLSQGEAIEKIQSLQYDGDGDLQQCNLVARFEHLTEDMSLISKWTNYDLTIPWQNPSTDKCNVSLSTKTIELIREVYSEDFKRFGYDTTWPSF